MTKSKAKKQIMGRYGPSKLRVLMVIASLQYLVIQLK